MNVDPSRSNQEESYQCLNEMFKPNISKQQYPLQASTILGSFTISKHKDHPFAFIVKNFSSSVTRNSVEFLFPHWTINDQRSKVTPAIPKSPNRNKISSVHEALRTRVPITEVKEEIRKGLNVHLDFTVSLFRVRFPADQGLRCERRFSKTV